MSPDYYENVVRDEFAESLRIPLVSNPYPVWCFITAVVVDETLYNAVRPTDDELRVVASFHEEYMEYWYGQSPWRRKMAERPFDVDGGANGRILLKDRRGGWHYRRSSWVGPEFWPDFRGEPVSLYDLLDHERTIAGEVLQRWVDWKNDHPELFPAVTT